MDGSINWARQLDSVWPDLKADREAGLGHHTQSSQWSGTETVLMGVTCYILWSYQLSPKDGDSRGPRLKTASMMAHLAF